MLLTKETIYNITGIAQSSISDDMLRWAESEVAALTGKDYTTDTNSEEIYLPESQDYLNMEKSNIVTISTFTYDDEDVDSNDYTLYKKAGIIYYSFDKNTKIELTYTYGDQDATDSEKHLCFLIFLRKIMMTQPSLITKEVISEKIGDYSIQYNTAKLAQSVDTLKDEIDRVKEMVNSYFFLA